MNLRIEFTERFIDMTDDEIESSHNLKQPLKFKYRLIYPRLSDIFSPRQIPDKKNHCEIEYFDGSIVVVKGSYQDICLLIDEREKLQDQYDSENGYQ